MEFQNIKIDDLGYVKIHRTIFASRIWSDEPHTLKLFIYLIGTARHNKKPKKFPGFLIKRGELVTSLSQLAENNQYIENGVLKTWSRSKVSRMLKLLEDQNYIELLSDTNGTHIRVCNYNTYQDPYNNFPNTGETEPNTGETGAVIYNNDKNDKNDKNNIYVQFDKFWEMYDLKKGKEDCLAYWTGERKLKNKKVITEENRIKILEMLPLYIKNTFKAGGYPARQHPKTFLYNSCWEDEVIIVPKTGIGKKELDEKKKKEQQEIDELYKEYENLTDDKQKIDILHLAKLSEREWNRMSLEARNNYKRVIVKYYKRVVIEGIKAEFAHIGKQNELDK